MCSLYTRKRLTSLFARIRTPMALGWCYQFYHCRFYQLGPDNSCYRTYQFRADNLSFHDGMLVVLQACPRNTTAIWISTPMVILVRSHEERRCSILGPTQSRISPSIQSYITEYTIVYHRVYLVYEDKHIMGATRVACALPPKALHASNHTTQLPRR